MMPQNLLLVYTTAGGAEERTLIADSDSSLNTILDRHNEADDSRRVSLHAVGATPLQHPWQFYGIAMFLLSRFQNLGHLNDLENAIAAFQKAIELMHDDQSVDMSRLLQNLGRSLRTRFQCFGKLDDLERAITANQTAVDIMPEGHPEVSDRLHSLGASLQVRFTCVGDPADLERAIVSLQNAIELMPDGNPNKAELLGDIGIVLHDRFHLVGKLDDLNEATAHHRHANELTPEGHRDKPDRFAQLGTVLLDRFLHFGQLDDIESAIENHQHAVKLTPEGHPNMPQRFAQLGTSLGIRFQHFGELDDLERAIANHWNAVEFTPEGHPDKPRRLAGLAIALVDRFRNLGELDDIERAIAYHQRAVELTPERHPDKPQRLAQLGTFLVNRFRRLNELDDLERAIEMIQCAVKLTPEGHPEKPSRLTELGLALSDRFRHLGELDDLERALASSQHALALTPEGHVDKSRRFVDLATSLGNRFVRLGEPHDLECAITNCQHAVEVTPEGHPDRVDRLGRLGFWLKIRFEREPSKVNFDAAVDHFMEANAQPLGNPSTRLNIARDCVSFLHRYHTLASAELVLRAHSHVMGILPEIVWLGHSIGRRYRETAQLTNVINPAVTIAIHLDDLSQAIEWLEAGRSLIWSQILSLRMPLHDLKSQHPSLAASLEVISKQLQHSGNSSHLSLSQKADTLPSFASAGPSSMSDQRQLAIQYDRTLRDIRRCSGFEDFLRSPKFASLLPVLEYSDGPIVFINLHPGSCDALALCLDGTLLRVKLPGLTEKRASQLRSLWMQNLERCHTRERRAVLPNTVPARGGMDMFGRILARLWTWVVQPILQHLDLIPDQPNSERLPHITWCPTGPLTQLPLHAAGIYDAKQHHRAHVFDFVVSSYTPSLSALLRCSKGSNHHRSSQPNMLVVAQPATPGLSHLPGTQKECARIRAIIPDTAYTLLEHEQAVVAKTATVINQYPWVHFACHGVQDAADPTQSAFALYDGRLTLSMLMGTVADDAELAFLSACQTAVGDEKIPEESAHLAAGMLVVGFKGVIATMWSIGDEDAPIVAEAYYRKLLDLRTSGAVGAGRTGAAYALHEAVRVLREKVGEQNFVKWAPFVHFGV